MKKIIGFAGVLILAVAAVSAVARMKDWNYHAGDANGLIQSAIDELDGRVYTNNLSTMNVGSLNVSTNAIVTGTITATGTVAAVNNATVGGTLAVTGTITGSGLVKGATLGISTGTLARVGNDLVWIEGGVTNVLDADISTP